MTIWPTIAARVARLPSPVSRRKRRAPPRLLFCVGAQKAGTTWLHAYLSGHPDCSLPLIKELHFFDRLFEGRIEENLGKFRQHGATLLREVENRTDAESLRTRAFAEECAEFGALVVEGQGDVAAYRDFLLRKSSDRPVTADITPAYATLTTAYLRTMATLLPDVRFLYVLRDPVDRLWSACKMGAKAATQTSGQALLDAAIDHFRRQAELHRAAALPRDENVQCRHGDYRTATARLDSAVAPGRLLMLYYDELFTTETLARLCDFMEIAPMPPLEDVVFGGESLDLPPDVARFGVECLEDQYRFAEERFGYLPDRWTRQLEAAR